MKKVELHVHLDGSVRPSTVSDILKLELDEAKNQMIVNEDNASLSDYLTKFDLPIRAMQEKDNLIRIAKELAQDLKKEDIIYAEIRFAPILHTKKGLSVDEVVSSVIEGINMVDDIKINIILCMMRGFSVEENLSVINIAEKYLNKGVVALDLAGDEKKYKTKDYEQLFKMASSKNIPFTIHAGEADDATSVLDAISFGAKRIGHGIRVLENQSALSLTKEKDVLLEICPTSNVQTKAVSSLDNHPIKTLYDKGILINVNTDNNTVSNITLNEEYEKLKKYFLFTDEDFLKMNIDAVKKSFMKNYEKEKYIKILENDFYNK